MYTKTQSLDVIGLDFEVARSVWQGLETIPKESENFTLTEKANEKSTEKIAKG